MKKKWTLTIVLVILLILVLLQTFQLQRLKADLSTPLPTNDVSGEASLDAPELVQDTIGELNGEVVLEESE